MSFSRYFPGVYARFSCCTPARSLLVLVLTQTRLQFSCSHVSVSSIRTDLLEDPVMTKFDFPAWWLEHFQLLLLLLLLPHDVIHSLKWSSSFCRKTPPQRDAAFTVLQSWDDVLLIKLIPLFSAHTSLIFTELFLCSLLITCTLHFGFFMSWSSSSFLA